jgi:hypothetical protein
LALFANHGGFRRAGCPRTQHDLAQLGFTPTAIGTCHWTPRDQSYDAQAISVVFEYGYLDLIEDRRPQWQGFVHTAPLCRRGLAPIGIVLGTPSVEDAYEQLSARGLPVLAPYSIVRELAGAQPSRIPYRIFGVDRTRMQLPFAIIQDAAPNAMRIPAWVAHRNSVRAIGRPASPHP